MRGIGTAINVATVVAGGTVGILVGDRIPEKVRSTVVQTIGLVTLVLGVSDALGTRNLVFPLMGMALGSIVGELADIEGRLECVGRALQRRFDRGKGKGRFVEGFVTATLLFCVGPLTILGSIQDASGQTPQLTIIKSTLDGFMSIVFTALYGIGTMFSALSVLVVQGLLTLGGAGLDSMLDDRMRKELFAAGGLIVMGIGLNLLDIKKVRVASMLPGLLITPLLVWLFARPTGLLFQ